MRKKYFSPRLAILIFVSLAFLASCDLFLTTDDTMMEGYRIYVACYTDGGLEMQGNLVDFPDITITSTSINYSDHSLETAEGTFLGYVTGQWDLINHEWDLAIRSNRRGVRDIHIEYSDDSWSDQLFTINGRTESINWFLSQF